MPARASIGGQADSINAYQYDALARLTGISQIGAAGPPDANHPPGVGYAASKFVSFSYLADGQFNQVKRFAGSAGSGTPAVTSTYRYDLAGRIEGIQHSNPPAQNLANYNWTWNAANRKASYTNALDSAENVTYAYDRAGQLVSADRLGAASDETYAFDKNGNRTQRNLGGVAQAYANNRDNELWSDGVSSFQYDHEGNLTKKTKLSDNSTAEYVWDHRNRLLQVTFKDGAGAVQKTVSQSYDPFDHWIGEKSVNAAGATLVERHFVYDGDQIALEFGAANTLTHRYLWGPAVDLALADEELGGGANAGLHWLLGDDQHSVRDVVNASGAAVINHIDYDGFGNVRGETNAAVSHLVGYTGRPFDGETGLQNNHRRWYDASTGRWISKDPIGFAAGDANLSRYVGNGPTNATDPSGLFVEGDSPPWGGPWGSPGSPVPVDDTPDDLPPIIVEFPRFPLPSSPIPGLPAPTGGPLPRGTPPIYRRSGPHTEILIDPGDDPDAPKIIVTPEEPSSFDLAADAGLCLGGYLGLEAWFARLAGRARSKAWRTLEELPGRVGKTGPIKTVPSEKALDDLFEGLCRGGQSVDPGTYRGVVKELPDGTRISRRAASKSGGATIDIKLPDGTVIKVHIEL